MACVINELLNYTGINLNLLYFDYKHQYEKYLKSKNEHICERIISVPQRFLIPFWKRFSWPHLEALLTECDIFYVNGFYFPPTRRSLVLATIHGLAYEIIPDKIPAKDVKALSNGLSYILKHADYLVAVSETTKNELIQFADVNPKRIYVVTHGVDKQFRHHIDQEEVWYRLKSIYGLTHPYILYVGAIGMHKNIMGILSAYELLSREVPHHLVMAGPPENAWDSAKQFIYENDLTSRVHFLGHVYDTDKLVDLYNGADLFVFPSFYEGWTSPPLESMACGTPVITSNCSSLPETVGKAAIKIDPNDSGSLAKEMITILSDRTLQQQMIAKGFNHVSQHTWDKAAAKMIEIFTNIMKRGAWRS